MTKTNIKIESFCRERSVCCSKGQDIVEQWNIFWRIACEREAVTKIYGFSWLVLKGAIWMKYFLLLHIAVADSGHESCDSKILVQRAVLLAVAFHPWLRQVTLSMVGEGLERRAADKNMNQTYQLHRQNGLFPTLQHGQLRGLFISRQPRTDGRFGVYF